ncbi:uncharacterized protein LOC122503240 [Leptopilina heterotoma]|uniref:uncharacterized protein LOC122503240 n=1 Tax=Leptopilina heterotoma TaxID=63436 RepID=UPI001CA92601|nr:uncharacterized protein LOC122503240 [Leptopilina heterotoma]XP_043469649.1 uncharacterized protein LOC122503240 [Leptopilina heterotoma]
MDEESDEERNSCVSSSETDDSNSEPETVIEKMTKANLDDDTTYYTASDSDSESKIVNISNSINQKLKSPNNNSGEINFEKHEYSYTKEKEVFLRMLRWRCDRREILEKNTEKKKSQDEEWRKLRKNNNEDYENYVKTLKGK